MHVEYIILANGAEAVNNHHYILGGGFDAIAAASVPATHARLAVAIKVSIPYEAMSAEHRLELSVVDQDERVVGQQFDVKFEAGRPAGMRSGDHQSLVLAFNFLNVQFDSYGPYSVVSRLDANEEGRSRFRVTEAAAPKPRA
ncbi:MAG: hypothetical protein KY395_07700 [Actinobacteria bacterium]|nr:hypothetical protein [Actinomycetota bacterium]